MHYGTAVHDACEKAVKFAIKNKHYPSKDEFIEYFKAKLNNLPVSTHAMREILKERGEKSSG